MNKILTILLVVLLLACGKRKEVIEVLHILDAFSQVELNSTFDVYLVEDSSYFIELIGVAKIIDKVDISNDNGVLKIKRTSKNDWLSPKNNKIKLIIHSLPLEGVTANKTCSILTSNPITSDEFGLVIKDKASEANLTLDCNIFFFWNNAPAGGRITLNGQCTILRMWTTAIVTVDATNTIVDNALVENDSKGDCNVFVNTLLDYSILNEGNVNVYGSPSEINLVEHSGSGELILH